MKRLALLLILGCACLFAGGKELKVLTIGNSFAWSVFDYLPKIVASVPECSLKLVSANHGGCSLERHWKYVTEEEASPDVKRYSGKKLRDLLVSEKWDYVTIQQVSHESITPETYQPFADNLVAYVRKHAPQAEILMQQTWAYRVDNGRLGEKGSWKISQEQMHEKVTGCYVKYSNELKLRVIPSGLAVAIARKEQNGKWIAPEAQQVSSLKYPELPNQDLSFIVGYRWRKDKKTGDMKMAHDTIHLNKRGEYLQSCVWFAFLFDMPTDKITFVPKNLKAEDCAFLRKCAQKAIVQGKEVFFNNK